jgi:hypothetical protein
MGAVASLSREATLCALDMAQIAVFVFGFFFLIGWIAEETAKDPWRKYRALFVVMAIGGVAGEWIADIAVFALSEHLQTISDKQVAKLKYDTQRLATEESEARRAIADAQRDVAAARRDAAKADVRAVEANLALERYKAPRAGFRLKLGELQGVTTPCLDCHQVYYRGLRLVRFSIQHMPPVRRTGALASLKS